MQPLLQGGGVVIRPLDQGLAGEVVLEGDPRGLEFDVIASTTLLMDPPPGNPNNITSASSGIELPLVQDPVWNIEVEDSGDVGADLLEHLVKANSLAESSRESIENGSTNAARSIWIRRKCTLGTCSYSF